MTINLKKIANPFTVFSISWFLCLCLYSLGWADIFPSISLHLFFFLSFLILLFAFTGVIFNKINSKPAAIVKLFDHRKLLIANACIYCTNYIYSGIPLLKGTREDEFGIPTIIVIATTLNSFTSVYCFYLFLVTGKKKFIFYSLTCLCFFILVFSRGNIMMSLVTMFFLWINLKSPVLTLKKIASIITGAVLVMYLFGLAGNFRTINDVYQKDPSFDKTYNSDLILSIGGATDGFKNSILPGEFFWTYLYVTSPLSNLQYNINKNSPRLTITGLTHIFVDELMFDTISKRIDSFFNRKRSEADLLVDQLTVPTTLAGSYNYAGWGGMAFFMAFFWLFPLLYIFFVIKNPLGVIGISTLCTVYFFSIFDNMFILTGLTFQILYPIIFYFLSRIKLRQLKSSTLT